MSGSVFSARFGCKYFNIIQPEVNIEVQFMGMHCSLGRNLNVIKMNNIYSVVPVIYKTTGAHCCSQVSPQRLCLSCVCVVVILVCKQGWDTD